MDGILKKVLIVEDDYSMRQALIEECRNQGLNVLQSEDGTQGLQVALKERPDIILLDILMPKTNGMSMLQKLRKDDWGSKVPVIILTNVDPGTDTSLKAITDYKPSYYLIKSDTTLDAVGNKIKELLFI